MTCINLLQCNHIKIVSITSVFQLGSFTMKSLMKLKNIHIMELLRTIKIMYVLDKLNLDNITHK